MFIDTRCCIGSCPLCRDRRFINRSALEEHFRNSSHHGWCEPCERLFRSRSDYTVHMSTVHRYAINPTRATSPDGAARPGNPIHRNRRPNSNSASRANHEANHNVECFGCDRLFHSYASMMLHLEQGSCITDMAELAQMAEQTNFSERYVAYGWRDYLRTQYGREQLPFDTDHETFWECVECRQGFGSLKWATQHAISPTHKPQVFKCPGCRTFFSALSGLLQHVEQSRSCPEGLYKGTSAMGRLLEVLKERFRDRNIDTLLEDDLP